MLKINKKLVSQYFYKQYKSIFLLLFLIFSGTVVGGIIPLLFGKIIDLILQKQIELVIQITMFFFLLSLLSLILSVIETYLGNKVVLEISNNIKKDLSNKIINMQMHGVDQYAKGELLNRVENDPAEVVSTYISFLTGGIQVVINIIISVYFALTFSSILTCLAIVFLVFSYVVTIFYKKEYQKAKEDLKKFEDVYYSEMTEDFRNIEGIKSFNLQNVVLDKLKQTFNKNFLLSQKMYIVEGKISFMKGMSSSLFEVVLLLGASILIINGKLSIGNLVSFNQYISNVFQSSSQVISYIMSLISSDVNVKRIEKIMESSQENTDENSAYIKEIKKLRIDNVSFKYKEDDVLQNINMEIDSPGLYSIVGINGAGKSTLLKIILELYEPREGNISFNDLNSKEISIENIRECISYIPKNPFLFNASIEYNLTLGTKIERSRLRDVCKKVGLDSFINSTEDGYETIVGDNGFLLSSGTKQKISIARAILKNSSLWICDELTSDLDGQIAGEIITLLKNVSRTKIVLQISHDLSSVRESKKIFVLNEKTILCTGNDSILKEQCALYRWLFYRDSTVLNNN